MVDGRVLDLLDNDAARQYWETGDEKIAQKFYMTVCLFVSATSDYAVGMDLQDDKKLNWSTTAYYYSIVHSLRMIIFGVVGDYPTSHENLRKVFTQSPEDTRVVMCDWLRKFRAIQSGSVPNGAARVVLESLKAHYRTNLRLNDADELFNCLGRIVQNAKELRNDSNYEALLMAHEYHHDRVTSSFRRLSQAMKEGAESTLRIATMCLNSILDNDRNLGNKRDAYSLLLNQYLVQRIYEPINQRIGKEPILQAVKEITKTLQRGYPQRNERTINREVEDISYLVDWISMGIFTDKTALMENFDKEIKNLEVNVRGVKTLLE